MKTTGDFRKELVDTFFLSRDGKLTGDQVRGCVGAANQINTSMAIELKARAQFVREEKEPPTWGEFPIVTSTQDSSNG